MNSPDTVSPPSGYETDTDAEVTTSRKQPRTKTADPLAYREFKRNGTQDSHLGVALINQVQGNVIHCRMKNATGMEWKVVYHTSECYEIVKRPEVLPFLQDLGLGGLAGMVPWGIDLPRCVQFLSTYNTNTLTGKVKAADGREVSLKLDINAVRSALYLPVMSEHYVQLRTARKILQGMYDKKDEDKQGVPYEAITREDLILPARALTLLTSLRWLDRYKRCNLNLLSRIYERKTCNWADYFHKELLSICSGHNQKIGCALILTKVIYHLANWPDVPEAAPNPYRSDLLIEDDQKEDKIIESQNSPEHKKRKMQKGSCAPCTAPTTSAALSTMTTKEMFILLNLNNPPDPTLQCSQFCTPVSAYPRTIPDPMATASSNRAASTIVDSLAEAFRWCSQGQYRTQEAYDAMRHQASTEAEEAERQWVNMLTHYAQTTRDIFQCKHEELAASRNFLNKAQQQIQKLQQQVEQEKRVAEDTRREVNRAQEEIATLQQKLKATEDNFYGFKQDADKHLQLCDQRDTCYQQTLAAKENQIQQLRQDVEAAQAAKTLLADPNDELERKVDVLMEAATNLAELPVSPRTPNDTLNLHLQSLTLSLLQFNIFLSQPLHPHHFTDLLSHVNSYSHPTLCMAFFQQALTLQDYSCLYSLPLHPIVLNFYSWCRVLQSSSKLHEMDEFIELSKPFALQDCPADAGSINKSLRWLQFRGWAEAASTKDHLLQHGSIQYHPCGIIVLYHRIHTQMCTQLDSGVYNFDDIHVAYPEDTSDEEVANATTFFDSMAPSQADENGSYKKSQGKNVSSSAMYTSTSSLSQPPPSSSSHSPSS